MKYLIVIGSVVGLVLLVVFTVSSLSGPNVVVVQVHNAEGTPLAAMVSTSQAVARGKAGRYTVEWTGTHDVSATVSARGYRRALMLLSPGVEEVVVVLKREEP